MPSKETTANLNRDENTSSPVWNLMAVVTSICGSLWCMRWNRHKNGTRWLARCHRYIQPSIKIIARKVPARVFIFNQCTIPRESDAVQSVIFAVGFEKSNPSTTALSAAMVRFLRACMTLLCLPWKNGAHVSKPKRTDTIPTVENAFM